MHIETLPVTTPCTYAYSVFHPQPIHTVYRAVNYYVRNPYLLLLI